MILKCRPLVKTEISYWLQRRCQEHCLVHLCVPVFPESRMWSTLGDDGRLKHDEATLMCDCAQCTWKACPFPLNNKSMELGHSFPTPIPGLWLATSAPRLAPCDLCRTCPWCCPGATEYFKHRADERDSKPLNHFEK